MRQSDCYPLLLIRCTSFRLLLAFYIQSHVLFEQTFYKTVCDDLFGLSPAVSDVSYYADFLGYFSDILSPSFPPILLILRRSTGGNNAITATNLLFVVMDESPDAAYLPDAASLPSENYILTVDAVGGAVYQMCIAAPLSFLTVLCRCGGNSRE